MTGWQMHVFGHWLTVGAWAIQVLGWSCQGCEGFGSGRRMPFVWE